MKFALLRERKATGDKRVLFSPNQLADIKKKHPQHQFVVESSPTRCFTDDNYRAKGITVINNVEDCDVLLGIKEVPLKYVIKNKTYFFFSHTTKKQQHNKNYLKGLKEKQITFFDYENLVDTNNRRLVAFGKSAGKIGGYHAIRTYGLKHGLYNLPKPNQFDSLEELEFFAANCNLPPIKIIITGTGNVGEGAADFLMSMKIPKVSPSDFLTKKYSTAVFTQLSKTDYLSHRENGHFCEQEFKLQPEQYRSHFVKYAKQAALLIAGHYYHKGMPLFFNRTDTLRSDFKINTIADISCDLYTPVPTCLRVSTPENPIYGYHKQTGTECNYRNPNAIAVMAVDNLPSELPKSSSIDFGNQFLEKILPHITENFDHPILKEACVFRQGVFTEKYSYLKDFLNNEKFHFSE